MGLRNPLASIGFMMDIRATLAGGVRRVGGVAWLPVGGCSGGVPVPAPDTTMGGKLTWSDVNDIW